MKDLTRRCAVCESSFTPKSSKQKLCGAASCRKEWQHRKNVEYYSTHKVERKQQWKQWARTHDRSKYYAQYRADNLECLRQKSQDYYREHREEFHIRFKNWSKQNADYNRARSRQWNHDNLERSRYNTRLWRNTHPDEVAKMKYRYQLGRRARIRSNGLYRVTQRDLDRLMNRFGNRCAYCGQPFSATVKPTFDHVVPVSRGGEHSIGNLLPACNTCNGIKTDRCLTEWLFPGNPACTCHKSTPPAGRHEERNL